MPAVRGHAGVGAGARGLSVMQAKLVSREVLPFLFSFAALVIGALLG